MFRIVIDGLDQHTVEAWTRASGGHPDHLNHTRKIPFGVFQAGAVNPNARGRDIKANLVLNYRGPFSIRAEDVRDLGDGQTMTTSIDPLVELVNKIAAKLGIKVQKPKAPKQLKGKTKTTKKLKSKSTKKSVKLLGGTSKKFVKKQLPALKKSKTVSRYLNDDEDFDTYRDEQINED